MPDPRSSNGHGWRGKRVWRLLTLAGVVVAVGSLFPKTEKGVDARGGHQTSPNAEAVALGFETTDVSARDVTLILAVIALTSAVVIGIVFAMVWRFDVNRAAVMSRLTREETAQIVPPAPHLQQDPFAELARNQAREARLLNGYGWINADHSLARIPIDRAMALSVGKSLDASP